MKTTTDQLVTRILIGGAVLTAGVAIGYMLHKTKINKLITACYAGAMAAGAYPIILRSKTGETLHMVAFDDTTNIHECAEEWIDYSL